MKRTYLMLAALSLIIAVLLFKNVAGDAGSNAIDTIHLPEEISTQPEVVASSTVSEKISDSEDLTRDEDPLSLEGKKEQLTQNS